MKVTYKDDKCIMIVFNEDHQTLRRNGWLGDESEARIFKPNSIDREIRIFKNNGESYILNETSSDEMVRMKIRKILELADNA